MTKTITISVSDELHETMMKWKDSFNFSGVFQEAIAEKIQRKEDFQKRLKEVTEDMNETIERLKLEKEEIFDKNEAYYKHTSLDDNDKKELLRLIDRMLFFAKGFRNMILCDDIAVYFSYGKYVQIPKLQDVYANRGYLTNQVYGGWFSTDLRAFDA